MKIFLPFLFLFCLLSVTLTAQDDMSSNYTSMAPNLELGLQVGYNTIQGDLVEDRFSFKSGGVAVGAYARKGLTQNLALRFSLFYGSAKADDKDYDGREQRGWKNEGALFEVSVLGEYTFVGQRGYNTAGSNTSLYGLAGIGVVNGSPELSGLTEAQLAKEEDGTTGMSIPVGLGLRQAFNDKFYLGLEGILHLTTSDKIDGISENGNPDANDTFFFIGLNLGYTLNSRNFDN